MKRLCFDTESNYYKPQGSTIGDLDHHRDWIRQFVQRKPIRWDCAVVYDEQTKEHLNFNANQIGDLLKLLATADELISHSGRRVDLLILEELCGVRRVDPILRLQHHDLFDLYNWTNLDDLTLRYLPHQTALFEADYQRRLHEADDLYPATRRGSTDNWRSEGHFIARRIAKARFDVERTYAVWSSLKCCHQSS